MNATSRALSPAEVEAFGRELDALAERVRRDLGRRDVEHIRGVIRLARRAEAGGRLLLHFGLGPLTFAAGAAALGLAKILENMEIGHNVIHGQYDWTGDPALDSRAYEWDIACAASDWRESHNFEHHTFTNVMGLDRDVGYGFLRVRAEQPWAPSHLAQPALAALLALFFQWGIGTHPLRLDEALAGRRPWCDSWRRGRPFARKAIRQLAKDYAIYPALALWNAPRVAAGNLVANGARNLWAFVIIFCGHFPEGARVYRADEVRDEGRGAWYLRQLHGSANIEGGRAMHLLSGHLSHQIEHHLFPDLPSARYPEMAPRVRELCARYGQAYNTGGLGRQFASVVAALCANALPPRRGRARAAPPHAGADPPRPSPPHAGADPPRPAA
jgi:fatty acid desaturase